MAMGYQPPHEVRDEGKLQGMIDALEAGKQLPPIVVLGEIAFSGSHRLAAWEYCEMSPEVVEIEDRDYCEAMAYLDIDNVNDFNEFIDALRAIGVSLGDAQ